MAEKFRILAESVEIREKKNSKSNLDNRASGDLFWNEIKNRSPDWQEKGFEVLIDAKNGILLLYVVGTRKQLEENGFAEQWDQAVPLCSSSKGRIG